MKKNITFFVATFFWMVILLPVTFAAYLKNVPQTLVQPNGDTLHCFATGDEFYHRLHDADGYTIILDKSTGYYVYADKVGDQLVPTSHIAGRANPATAGLTPGLSISAEQWRARRQKWESSTPALTRSQTRAGERNHGHINNLVVFIRFADDDPFENDFSSVEAMFNSPTPGDNSMYNYFKSATYDQLTITSTFYPTQSGTTILSYQDTYSRSYFEPWSSDNPDGYDEDNDNERTTREHQLLKRAVNAISDMVPSDLDIDYDLDGYVDNVCFLVRGNVGEWNDLLWPHRWSLYSESAYINGKRVYDFNFQLADNIYYFNTSVLCHEMNHSLSAPDLYHYYDDTGLAPVGPWDLMAQNGSTPQHMGAYMKYKYGNWISEIPEITECGTYTLHSLGSSATNNCYRIASPNSNEFFVLEYRNTNDYFESSLPRSGLLVYRINTDFDGNASYDGETIFDEVYLYRPNGTPDNNGNINQAAFSENSGRTEMNANTNPYPFLTDGSVVSVGDFTLRDISTAGGEVMTFTVCQSGSVAQLPTVTTNNVSDINYNSATGGGNIISEGGESVTAKGICWSTSHDPTLNNSHSILSYGGTGSFSSGIMFLTDNTTYYVRAYATNSVGTAYGNEVCFTTTEAPQTGQPCPVTPTVTDIDGNVYNTVLIGQQCWMRDNLRTRKYADNTVIEQGNSTPATTAYWYYPNNNASNETNYGLFYNWKAVMKDSPSSSANPSGVQGICPTGWHVPSDAEWTVLKDYVSNQSQYVCGSDNTYIAKALASHTGWRNSSLDCVAGNTSSDNNATGFGARPAGCYWGPFGYFSYEALFWSSTEQDENNADFWRIQHNSTTLFNGADTKPHGISVRCIRDEGNNTSYVPSVTTTEVSDITESTAICGGNVISNGNATVTARGVCWSTSHNPTLNDSHTTDGSGTGSFTSSITGLTPNTTYYVRAYATNSVGTAYGNEESFSTSTASGPIVDYELMGFIDNTTDLNYITELNLNWDEDLNTYIVINNNGPDIPDANDEIYIDISINNFDIGSLSFLGTNLASYTMGHAFLIRSVPLLSNSDLDDFIDEFGSPFELCFEVRIEGSATDPVSSNNTACITVNRGSSTQLPTVTTSTVTNISATSATCGGNVTSNGGASVTARGVCWSTNNNPTIADSHTNDGTGTGSFFSSITGLTESTIYYVRAYATNSVGTAYGNVVIFSTGCNSANVSISSSTASFYSDNTNATIVLTAGDVWGDGTGYQILIDADNAGWESTSGPSCGSIYTDWEYMIPMNASANDAAAVVNATESISIPSGTYSYIILNPSCNDYSSNYIASSQCDATNVRDFIFEAGKIYTFTPVLGGPNSTQNDCTTLTVSDNTAYTSYTTTIDYGQSTTLTASGASSYLWSTGATTAAITVSPTTTTTYTVTGTDAYGCTGTVSITVIVNNTIPTVTTSTVSNISATSATCGGNVTSDGGSYVYYRGVCYGTTPNQFFTENYTINGEGTGTFTSNLTNLTPNTTYYVRAFAINDAGTAYGDEYSFTTGCDAVDIHISGITTIDYGQSTTLTAYDNYSTTTTSEFLLYSVGFESSEGFITSNTYNNDNITLYGFDGQQWGTIHGAVSTNDPITGSQSLQMRYYGSTSSGNAHYGHIGYGLTTFDVENVTRVEFTAKSTYNLNVRVSFSYDGGETFIGDAVYTLSESPQQLTYDISNYGVYPQVRVKFAVELPYQAPTATAHLYIDDVNFYGATYQSSTSFLWSTGEQSSSITVAPAATTTYTVTGTNQYGCTGTASATVIVTSQNPTIPTVTTNNVTNNTMNTATCGGNVVSDGGATVTARGVCWSTSPNPTLSDSHTSDGNGTGNFSSSLTALAPNTTYYVRAYATNSVGTAYGNEVSFSTSCGNVIVEISGNTELCEGDTATLIATGATTYQWNTGTTGNILQTGTEGTYSVIGTDTNGCWAAASVTVTVHIPATPSLTVDGEISACNEGTATLSVEGNYTSYLWSTGETTPSIEVTTPGYYWVALTDEYGCNAISEVSHLGVSILIPETPAICMVGVENNHNLIVWEELNNANVRNYRIYRENDQANIFELLATVPASQGNSYEDSTANPSVRAYRYKVTAMDVCQGETPMSEFHKTIHLTINRGIGESWNLIWTPYEGMEFPSYRLYRGTTPDNLEVIATMPSTLTTLTDFEAPEGALYYQIEMLMESSCQLHTRDVTDYAGSRSNIVYNGEPAISGISGYATTDLRIYPNPTTGIVTIELAPETCTLKPEIHLFDIYGRRLQIISVTDKTTQIDLSHYATGVYAIKVVNDGNVIAVGKVVKE